MGVSKTNGTPKSSILIGFSIINHPFWGVSPYFWKHPYVFQREKQRGKSSKASSETSAAITSREAAPYNFMKNTWMSQEFGI